MVRVGLIGFGLAGQAFHAPVIRGVPGMELACILERHGYHQYDSRHTGQAIAEQRHRLPGQEHPGWPAHPPHHGGVSRATGGLRRLRAP